ncbi:MAG: clostripain-related cysteine peptidase [Anaerolineae bacterium]
METRAKWTFMVYLAGDNNLSMAGEKDLNEMRRVGSTDDVNIIAEFDRIGPSHETRRYRIQRDGADERTLSLGETDSGDPQVLLSFLEWASRNYPADRYALVLWNHGGGWSPEEMDGVARSVNPVDYSGREVVARSSSSLGRVLFRTTLEKIFQAPSLHARAILTDDGTGHSLDTIELGNVLAEAVDIFGQKLDLLGMDACLMSNLEVAFQAQSYVRYIVASEENEPNDGWPYDAVLDYLVRNPEVETADFAAHIVQAYVESYVERAYSGSVTQAALDLSQVGTLTHPIDALSKAMMPNMAAGKQWLGEALYKTEARFRDSTLWDVAEVCEYLQDESDRQDVQEAAKAVCDALQPQNEDFVIAERHYGSKVEHCGGITIYLPPRVLHRISPYYKDTAYARTHTWLELLEAYHAT